MMKQRQKTINCLLICSLLLTSLLLSGQNVEKLYVNMPDVLNPTLSKQNRLELLEYYKAHLADSIGNRFGNQAFILKLDTINEHITVKNTASSTFDLKIITLEDGTKGIGIIRTVCGPICQSAVEFYDTVWHPIPLDFTMPKALDWLKNDGLNTENVDVKWVKSMLENSFVSLSFDSANSDILAKNNSLNFLNEEDRKTILPMVDDKILRFELKHKVWVVKP